MDCWVAVFGCCGVSGTATKNPDEPEDGYAAITGHVGAGRAGGAGDRRLVAEPLTCISPVVAAADSVILRPCTQRPATPSAMSWRSLPWAIALLLTCIVVADLLPAR